MKGARLVALNILIGPFVIVGLMLAELTILAFVPGWLAWKRVRERRYGMAAITFFGWYAPVFMFALALALRAIR